MPSNLSADSVQETSVELSWDEGNDDDGAEEIRVRREQLVDGEYWPAITAVTVGAGVGTATDRTAQPDREYRYRVQSVDEDGTVLDESGTITVETPGTGVSSTPAPAAGWRVEITPPGGPLRTLSISDPTLLPTINGTPSMRIDAPRDETWQQDRYDDAAAAVWRDGIKQPIDDLDSREVGPASSSLSLSGGSQLGQRVVARSDDVEPVADFVERLIANETTYEPVIDNADQQIRDNVELQLADSLAGLQAAFESIPADVPLQWEGDYLVPLQTAWVNGLDNEGVSRSDFVGGSGVEFSFGEQREITINLDYETDSLRFYARGQETSGEDEFISLIVEDEGFNNVADIGSPPDDSVGWTNNSINGTYGPGTHEFTLTPSSKVNSGSAEIDVISVVDGRYGHTFDNTLDEPSGDLDGPEPYPDAVPLELGQINTPLAVVETTLTATTVSGDVLPQMSLRQDGDGSYVTETDTLSTTLSYTDLAAQVQARVSLGRREGLDPRDQTPRLGYEPTKLDTIALEADLDETPVLINRTFDDILVDVLRESMEIYDGAFEVREGDPPELHVSRIDGRPVDVDPAISDVSVDRDTSGAVDRAIVYAAAESIRQLPFSATKDQWEQLPLNDGRIVEQSETIRDGPEGTPLDRGDDYDIREVVETGTPEIKLLTSVSDPHIDCQYKPRGFYEASDAPQYPDEIVRDAPELNSKQMADLAAFQAVEGSYTDATIDATVELPPREIGFDVIDALNVANLPGDEPYQVRDVEISPQRIRVRLGAGTTAAEAIQEIRDRTSRVSERV